MLIDFDEIESIEEEENVSIEVNTSVNIEVEEIFSSNFNLTLNNHSLSPEERQRALQILKLTFVK